MATLTESLDEVPSKRRSRVKIAVSVAVVMAFIVLFAFGLLTQGSDDTIDRQLGQGRPAPAPEFTLAVLDRGQLPPALEGATRALDQDLSLFELRGTPIVLNFWASWCLPCRDEADTLQAGWERHGPGGVLYLGLDMQDLTDDALAFVEEFSITYPTIRDPGRDVANDYGTIGIPETYFIDARGRVVAHMIGVVTDELLDAGVEAAKTGQAIDPRSGGAIDPQR